MKFFATIACLLAAFSFSVPALAQSDAGKAAAESLFQEGKKLLDEGKHLEAAKKFQASQRLDPGIGTLLYTADAFEKAGKLASAWANFREAQDLAQLAGQQQRVDVANQRAGKLAPRLSKLNIIVASKQKIKGFAVKRNGEIVADALWGNATPIDAGSYQLEASAPGYATWSKNIEVNEEGKTTTIEIPSLEKQAAAGDAPAMAEPEGVAGASTGYKAAAIGLTVLGAAGLGVGSYFAIDAKGKNDDASANCGDSSCSSQAAADLTSQALTSSHVATGSFAVGGAALAGGLLMWLMAPSAEADDAATHALPIHVLPVVADNGGGLWFRGSW
jgi:tetratricopeptide (TPR) repeat protein